MALNIGIPLTLFYNSLWDSFIYLFLWMSLLVEHNLNLKFLKLNSTNSSAKMNTSCGSQWSQMSKDVSVVTEPTHPASSFTGTMCDFYFPFQLNLNVFRMWHNGKNKTKQQQNLLEITISLQYCSYNRVQIYLNVVQLDLNNAFQVSWSSR